MLDDLRSRVSKLEDALRALLAAREQAEDDLRSRKEAREDALRTGTVAAQAQLKASLRQIQDSLAAERGRIEEKGARDIEKLERAYASSRAGRKDKLRRKQERLTEDARKAKDQAIAALEERHARYVESLNAHRAESVDLRTEALQHKERVERFADGVGIAPNGRPPAAPLEPIPPEQVADALRRRMSDGLALLDQGRSDGGMRLLRWAPLPVMIVLILLAHGGALYGVRERAPEWTQKAGVAAAVTFPICLIAAIFGYVRLKRRARARVGALRAGAAEILSILQRHESFVAAGLGGSKDKLIEGKINVASEIEEKFRAQDEETDKASEEGAVDLQRRRDILTARVARRKDARLRVVRERAETETKAAEQRHQAEVARLRQASAEEEKRIDAEGRAKLAALAADTERVTGEFGREAGEARRAILDLHPRWGDERWKKFRLPEQFPGPVHVGDLRLDSALLPLALSFPSQGCLLVSADPETRARAFDAAFNTILRILTRFPAGKARFLIFDPVGLGQSFSALMHLADHDESLVGGRIWTESAHIERKLNELTEHVEKVIQKYLRNRYASIDEYNRDVGTMAESYRFLVLADFPTGFSALAQERLASLVASGTRCGVYTLILHDRRQKLPAGLDIARLKNNGLMLRSERDGFRVADEVLERGLMALEAAPEPAALTSLLHAIGAQCADSRRVEVPYDVVAPRGEQEWSLTSESGIRVPLGRASADRLQFLDLGRGTQQHALAAGKTGSGKSTLFHVMITNLAAWYGPRELEFYLIDFKKGVEFKRYASNALPHARVVAIESDREFGLSALRRIDRELAHRAELFRAKGAQDFAGYRRSGAEEYLPRTLLVVDEFQEFFVEEDAIAQEAALLLDRIVRQGRAFGVHVVLGSQTLGGSYTLAKATLGQMAVRIALQCNEADSYLILNDDNAAARLLSRPGEAIYNDMSGVVEGNNPFQVVWLPDEAHDRQLRRVRERAEREPWRPREPMTVFEGNVPADIRNNGLLRKRLANPFVPDEDGIARAWVGEANAIKGPTEVRFRAQGGSNLLIVGPQRESAVSVLVSSVVSIASAYPPGAVRFLILDGSPPEVGDGRHLEALARTVPQEIELVEYAKVDAVMAELDEEVRARGDGARGVERAVFVVIHDLQRYRKLRQGDEFDFKEGDKPGADRCFQNVLAEGPSRRVHAIVWCDSLSNLNRTFNRKALREFQSRILFQMSAADSSELIDTPHAGKLGLHRGLLFLEDEGTIEKFRPYAMPDADRLEEIRAALQAAAQRRGRPRGAPSGS